MKKPLPALFAVVAALFKLCGLRALICTAAAAPSRFRSLRELSGQQFGGLIQLHAILASAFDQETPEQFADAAAGMYSRRPCSRARLWIVADDGHGEHIAPEAVNQLARRVHGAGGGLAHQFFDARRDAFICFQPRSIAAVRLEASRLEGSIDRETFDDPAGEPFVPTIRENRHLDHLSDPINIRRAVAFR
jgi:hypothetical protein